MITILLQKILGEVESMDNPQEILSKVKQINERATLFRITTTAMINVSYCHSSGSII